MEQLKSQCGMIGVSMLDKDNYPICKLTIKAFTDNKNLAEHMIGNVPIPAEKYARKVELKKNSQAGRLILSTIRNELRRGIDDEIVNFTPWEILKAIYSKYASRVLSWRT